MHPDRRYLLPSDEVRTARQGEGAMWICSKCEAKVEPSFEVCWRCGTSYEGEEDPDFVAADESPSVQDPTDYRRLDARKSTDPELSDPPPVLAPGFESNDLMKPKLVADQARSDAMKANDPRGMPKGVRVRAYAAIFAVAASIMLPLWFWYVGPSLQQSGRGMDRGIGLPLILASVLATSVFRYLGLSVAGKTVETRRKVGGDKFMGGIEPVLEVNYPSFFHKPQIVVLPFSLFVMSVLIVFVPPSPWGFWCGAAGAVASGGLALFCLNLFRNPALRLDDEGILSYPSGGFGLRHQFAPWSEVASYSIETSRDDFGQATKTTLSFADSRGVPLLMFRPTSLPATDRDRVEQFLAAKFPKVEIDPPWEL